MDTQNYKRTLAGSVGAGMGALMGSSGKTYFVIEHKTSSKYHQAGESQKIIIDQIELGRAATCQVRFDESFETVSRRHAAIVKEGDNWKLVHLSQSNPTLVNGMPINGSYYLQNGDEIQLSVNGPRMGFIIPQGRQALTSSIGLTERMSLFRQQALRPYKRALYIMGIVFLIIVAAFSFWGYNLGQENKLQGEQILAQENQITAQDQKIANQREKLLEQDRLMRELENDKTNIQEQLEELKKEEASMDENNRKKIASLTAALNEVQHKLKETEKVKKETEASIVSYDKTKTASSNISGNTESSSKNASSDLSDYYDYIYTIKIDRIDIEARGRKFTPNIQTSEIICGTGFVLEDGTFITDRKNIDPWLFQTENNKQNKWMDEFAKYKAYGMNIIIHYSAYSTKGTGAPISFTNNDFITESSEPLQVIMHKVDEDHIDDLEDEYNLKLYLDEGDLVEMHRFPQNAYSWAYIKNKFPKGQGIPYNTQIASNLPGGTDIHMVGYAGASNIHALRPAHYNDRTNVADTKFNAIILQNRVPEAGYYGSPAFHKNQDGKYEVIGLMVGSVDGKDRLIPISNIKD